jgi:hypothetical protein
MYDDPPPGPAMPGEQALRDVARRAIHAADTRQYELARALDEALVDQDARTRFVHGEAVFLRALRF